ncbi:hypothetical protein D1007_43440 [Hordeum vulgare]|nr:hypothetical protein D1007_43440 [Hordeum vulgare]
MATDDRELRMDDDECPAADGSFSTRLSPSACARLRIFSQKKEAICKGSFGSILNINSFYVPVNLLDWVVMKIDPEKALLRTWVLLCIALVLCPGTGNMVPLEYLASLVDMDKINEFSWDEHFLVAALNEVGSQMSFLWFVHIIYMDFVEVPHLLVSEHRIEYSLPRACFACNDDFKLIEEIDRNKLSLDKKEFGKRNLRRLVETSNLQLEGCNEAHRENNNFVGADAHIHDTKQPTHGWMRNSW